MASKPWGIQHVGGVATPPALLDLQAYQTLVGASPQWAGWSKNFVGSNSSYTASEFTTVLNFGATPFLTWTPDDTAQTQHFSNANIMDGTHDAYIDSYANGIKALSGTVYLRFAHEPNGSWYDWSPGLNGNTTTSYVNMWKYVHDRFTALSVTNVKWVWCMNIHAFSENTTNWTLLYPGSSYVDVAGVDGYCYGDCSPHFWQDFLTVFSSSLTDLAAAAPTKSICVAEVGCTESLCGSGNTKSAWIYDALSRMRQDTRITSFLWYDSNSANGDMRLATSASATKAFKDSLPVVTSFGSVNM